MWLDRAGRYPFLDEHYPIGIAARGTAARGAFGMTCEQWVGDEIRLVLEFEAVRQE